MFVFLGVMGIFFTFIVVSNHFSPVSWVEKIKYFHVKEIRVTGEPPIPIEKIKQDLNSLKGKSLILLDTTELAESIEENGWVRGVVVKKEYPNQVSFFLEPERPVFIFLNKNLAFYLNSSGKEISKISEHGGYLDLPVIGFRDNKLPLANLKEHGWNVERLHGMLKKWESSTHLKVAQVILDSYPFLRYFIQSPKIEIILSDENFELNLLEMEKLNHSSPIPLMRLNSINLLFPKKAIVSSINSN